MNWYVNANVFLGYGIAPRYKGSSVVTSPREQITAIIAPCCRYDTAGAFDFIWELGVS